MASELASYISLRKKEGFTRAQVESALIRAGWAKASIANALDRAYPPARTQSQQKTPGEKNIPPARASLPENQVRQPEENIVHPPHDYLQPKSAPLPIIRIMVPETEQTYAQISVVNQILAFLFFLFLLAIAVIFIAIVTGILAAMGANAAIVALCLLFLAAPLLIDSGMEAFYTLDSFRFSLQKEFAIVRAGAISPSYEMVPYENVQDAQVAQGLIDRIFGLATVTISTPASNLLVPGIKLDVARKFREDLLSLSRMHKHMAE